MVKQSFLELRNLLALVKPHPLKPSVYEPVPLSVFNQVLESDRVLKQEKKIHVQVRGADRGVCEAGLHCWGRCLCLKMDSLINQIC